MPKKPPRDNPKGRELRTVHTAGAGAAAVLQRIKDGAKVELHPPQEAAGRLAPAARAVLGALPAQLAAHIVDTLGKDGELVVFMDSAVWAARLKLWLGEHSGELAGQRVTVRIRQQQRDKR